MSCFQNNLNSVVVNIAFNMMVVYMASGVSMKSLYLADAGKIKSQVIHDLHLHYIQVYISFEKDELFIELFFDLGRDLGQSKQLRPG